MIIHYRKYKDKECFNMTKYLHRHPENYRNNSNSMFEEWGKKNKNNFTQLFTYDCSHNQLHCDNSMTNPASINDLLANSVLFWQETNSFLWTILTGCHFIQVSTWTLKRFSQRQFPARVTSLLRSGVMEMQMFMLPYIQHFSKPWRRYPQRTSAASPSQHKPGTSHPPSGPEGTAAVRKREESCDHFGNKGQLNELLEFCTNCVLIYYKGVA